MATNVHSIAVRESIGALRTLQVLVSKPDRPTSAAPDVSAPDQYLLEGVPVEKVGEKSYRVTSSGVELAE
ncbi:MAG: hypothetical protein EON54_09135, partial [Alcaligenaceae bacterium]